MNCYGKQCQDVRKNWVDIGKFFAIMAVLVDHTSGTLYESEYIAWLSYFSVELFILLMGITTYWSFYKGDDTLGRKVFKRIKAIFIPYVIATIIYSTFLYGAMDIEKILHHIFYFDASLHFYYVSLYIQLLLISPIMFAIIKKCHLHKKSKRVVCYLCILLTLYLLANRTTNYSNVCNIFGSGGKLFGGSEIILLFIGMVLSSELKEKDRTIKYSVIGLMMSSTIYFGMWLFMARYGLRLDTYFHLGEGFNPPGISLIVYAISVLGIVYFGVYFIVKMRCHFIEMIVKFMEYIGKHTLYIFLYHSLLIRCIFIEKISPVKTVICFVIVIGGSLLIEKLINKVIFYIKNCYLYRAKGISEIE